MGTHSRLRDWGLLLTCNFIWSCYFVLVKLVQSQVGPLFATIFPISLAMALLIPIVHRQRRQRIELEGDSRMLSLRDIWDFVLLGVCGQVVTQLFGAWGTRLSLASNGALLGLTAPISTAAMAYFLLGERMSRLRWASFVLAIVGVLECSGINWMGADLASRRFLLGNIMLFVSIFGSAFYNVYSKRLLSRHLPLEILLYSYYSAIAFMLPIGISTEPHFFRDIPHFTPVVWLGFALLAIFHYFLSMLIFLNVLTRVDAIPVGLSNYLIPFFGLIVAAVVLHERLTKFMVVGGLLVLVSTLLVTVYEER